MLIDCPYSANCSQHNILCDTCKHNAKRSYYEPETHQYYYYPYPIISPWYPCYPTNPWYAPTITYCTTNKG